MKPRLYLETTIPSYLVARPSRDLILAGQQEATREWWDEKRADFTMFISGVVVREIRKGEAEMAALRMSKVSGLPVLEPTDASEELATRLLASGIVPVKAADDATHIALAAAHGMDFLLTWNCKHINNRFTFRGIEKECVACGLICPVIATPTELMNLGP